VMYYVAVSLTMFDKQSNRRRIEVANRSCNHRITVADVFLRAVVPRCCMFTISQHHCFDRR